MSVGGNVSAAALGNNLSVAIWGPQTADGNTEQWENTWTGGDWGGWAALDFEEIDTPAGASTTITGPPCVISGAGPTQLDFLGTDSLGDLWHVWQVSGLWGKWKYLGAPSAISPSSALAGVSRKTDMVDVFALGTDQGLWHRARIAAGWEKWENLYGPPADNAGPEGLPTQGLRSAPCAISCNPERIDVVAVAEDLNLWHIAWPASTKGLWTNWSCFFPLAESGQYNDSPNFSGPPGIAPVSDNQFVVFVTGQYGSLWYFLSADVGPSSGYMLLDLGSVSSPPVAVTGGPNLVDLCAVDSTGTLVHVPLAWDVAGVSLKAGSGYGAMPQNAPPLQPLSPPCPVVTIPNQQLHVFAVDQQQELVHFFTDANGAWAFEYLGGEQVHQ